MTDDDEGRLRCPILLATLLALVAWALLALVAWAVLGGIVRPVARWLA